MSYRVFLWLKEFFISRPSIPPSARLRTGRVALRQTPDRQRMQIFSTREKKILNYKKCKKVEFDPNRLTAYLRELAGTFHTLFTAGVKDDSKRFLLPHNPELTQARLSLITGLKLVLSNALSLIGIPPLERM